MIIPFGPKYYIYSVPDAWKNLILNAPSLTESQKELIIDDLKEQFDDLTRSSRSDASAKSFTIPLALAFLVLVVPLLAKSGVFGAVLILITLFAFIAYGLTKTFKKDDVANGENNSETDTDIFTDSGYDADLDKLDGRELVVAYLKRATNRASKMSLANIVLGSEITESLRTKEEDFTCLFTETERASFTYYADHHAAELLTRNIKPSELPAGIKPNKQKWQERLNDYRGLLSLDSIVVPPASSDSKDKNDVELNVEEEYWNLVSFIYQKLKKTSVYKDWREAQFDCQLGRCVICGKPMDQGYTQVDHIKPRRKFGTNYSDNLALVHRKCNEDKSASEGYVRPTWIKPNPSAKDFDTKVWELTEQVLNDEMVGGAVASHFRPPKSAE